MKSKKGGAWIPESPDGLVTQGVGITYDLPSSLLFAFLGNEIEKIRIFSSKGSFDIKWPASKKDLVINCLRVMTEPRKNFKVAEPDPDIQHEISPPKEKSKEDNF